MDNLQTYNRYSYVRNNPLTLTDPSGFSSMDGDSLFGGSIDSGMWASSFADFNRGFGSTTMTRLSDADRWNRIDIDKGISSQSQSGIYSIGGVYVWSGGLSLEHNGASATQPLSYLDQGTKGNGGFWSGFGKSFVNAMRSEAEYGLDKGPGQILAEKYILEGQLGINSLHSHLPYAEYNNTAEKVGAAGAILSSVFIPGPGNKSQNLSRSVAQRLADKAQNLSGKQRPNTIAVISHKNGAITIGRNQGGYENSIVQEALKRAPSNCFAGQCAEINALSRALNNGRSLEGATISIVNVRGPASQTGLHGTFKKPCTTCTSVLGQFGVSIRK